VLDAVCAGRFVVSAEPVLEVDVAQLIGASKDHDGGGLLAALGEEMLQVQVGGRAQRFRGRSPGL
jgi:hypothetical protein